FEDKSHDINFQCIQGGKSYGSYGIPSKEVMKALRHESQLVINYNHSKVILLSLKGSNNAISKLSSCLN
ncbi:MAG: hypothetical protein ACI9AT_001651, partial [Ulvibacter sp.]